MSAGPLGRVPLAELISPWAARGAPRSHFQNRLLTLGSVNLQQHDTYEAEIVHTPPKGRTDVAFFHLIHRRRLEGWVVCESEAIGAGQLKVTFRRMN